ncbi:response regulator [Roseivirga sp.]|uniref:response regulator n=1 Tax=Roseivirga sp. TaxID=1964215 RepID=UPI003B8C3A42
MIRVFIVDDHQVVIDGLSSILSDDDNIKFCGSALNGKDAIQQLETECPDVVLLDINMPEMDGIQVVKELRKRGDEVRILVLTMHNNPQFTKELIQMGVEGCILKNAGQKELILAINEVNKGERYYGKDVSDSLFESVKKTQDAVAKVQLTKREVQIIKLIASEYTTNEIATELAISTHTVDTHRKNIVSKLGIKNTAGLVKFAIEKGIV